MRVSSGFSDPNPRAPPIRMAVETELKLSLPAGALPALRRHPLLAGVSPTRQRLANTYYDTPALDLKRARIALRHRRLSWGLLLTVKSAEPAAGGLARRSEWEAPSLPDTFDFSHVDDKRLRARLEGWVPDLKPAFSTDFLRTTWIVSHAGARIEVALDRGEVRCDACGEGEGGAAVDPICELELELLEGPASALFDLALALQADLPLRPAVASKAERGFRLFTRAPDKPFRAGASPVTAEMSPRAAFVATAMDCIEQLQRNEAGVLRGDDAEFVHQARVAIRRLRSAMRFWAPVLPEGFRERFDPVWQALARVLGDERNLDVFVGHTLPPLTARFPERAALHRLAAAAQRRRAACRRATRAALEHPEYARLVLQFVAAVLVLAEDGAAAGEGASDAEGAGMAAFARQRLSCALRTVRRRGAAIGGDPEAHHRLRIAFKRLRYSLEFCATFYPEKRLRRYLGAASEMQEVLGDMNDIAVAAGIAAELRGVGRDPLLAGWFSGRGELLAELLPPALAGFIEARPPWKRRT
jgi:inorganic triphosphatase YgiF